MNREYVRYVYIYDMHMMCGSFYFTISFMQEKGLLLAIQYFIKFYMFTDDASVLVFTHIHCGTNFG